LRRFAPFCLLVGIELPGRWVCRGRTGVLNRRVEFLNRCGKRCLSLSLSIVKVIATGDVKQNDTGYNADRDNKWTTTLLKPVLSFLIEPDHRVVSVLHLLDGDLFLFSCCFRQNAEPPIASTEFRIRQNESRRISRVQTREMHLRSEGCHTRTSI